ncbi:hypothetical protein CDCA_CDCA06G1846 [Cyanidium caldarium]|uniref:DNA repair and recombination protein RAD52 n=1 Tax=Cyanidium caldarium TaxID=2771 RepID=A0AAV9IUK4_CYACA|nr:hypothetical protein CDCA_CDCA06G1846 [Cyanidium caldarium]
MNAPLCVPAVKAEGVSGVNKRSAAPTAAPLVRSPPPSIAKPTWLPATPPKSARRGVVGTMGRQLKWETNALPTEAPAADEAPVREALEARIPVEQVSKRIGPGGRPLYYLQGWQVIQTANDIFGYDGWSNTILSFEVDFCEQQPDGRWSAMASVVMRVTLHRRGTFHDDVGCGQCDGARTRGDALQKVRKEACTDALKRSLKNFGKRLGLMLYDKAFLAQVAVEQRAHEQHNRGGAWDASKRPRVQSGVGGVARPTTAAMTERVPVSAPGSAPQAPPPLPPPPPPPASTTGEAASPGGSPGSRVPSKQELDELLLHFELDDES